MTQYVIRRRADDYYYTHYGFSADEDHAARFDFLTEAELVILAHRLPDCDVVAVKAD